MLIQAFHECSTACFCGFQEIGGNWRLASTKTLIERTNQVSMLVFVLHAAAEEGHSKWKGIYRASSP
jgi:hypothetical protein